MTTVPYIISGQALTFYVESAPYQVNKSSSFWVSIIDELSSPEPDLDTLVRLASPFDSLNDQINTMVEVDLLPAGIVGVTRHGVTYNGEVLHNVLADRMLEILNLGLDIVPWIKFMENLYRNPAEHAREELYLWLEKSDLPITADGHFLAYKRVARDYYDIYSHTIYNGVGTVVEMPGGRQEVDPVRDRTCSRGLHFCSKSYLPYYRGDNGIVLVVKINPSDVVSIPSDYDNAKGRTWKYEVVDEIAEDKITRGWDAPINYDYDDDADDLDDEDDDDFDADFWQAFDTWIDGPDDDDDDDVEFDDEIDDDAQLKAYYEGLPFGQLRREAAAIAKNHSISSHDIWKVWGRDELVTFALNHG